MVISQLYLRSLQSFLVVAEELNFSRAAQRLNVAQPALSQQIKQLEDRLGVVLFERAERPLRLTDAGEFFRVEVQQIIASLERAVAVTKQIYDGKKGWLGIGFTRSAMYSVLPGALSAFAARYPEVELKLYELLTEQQPEALRDRRIHVGIARDPDECQGLQADNLLDEELFVALPTNHRLASLPAIEMEVLAREPFILFPQDAQAKFPRLVLSICADSGFTPHVAHRALEIQTALGLVSAGLGVSLVAASVAFHKRSDLVFLPVVARKVPRRTSLVALFRQGDDSIHLSLIREILRDECSAYAQSHSQPDIRRNL